MPTYQVQLKRTITLYAIVEVDSPNEAQARRDAREVVQDQDGSDATYGKWMVRNTREKVAK